jgi:hypothetical protein
VAGVAPEFEAAATGVAVVRSAGGVVGNLSTPSHAIASSSQLLALSITPGLCCMASSV